MHQFGILAGSTFRRATCDAELFRSYVCDEGEKDHLLECVCHFVRQHFRSVANGAPKVANIFEAVAIETG